MVLQDLGDASASSGGFNDAPYPSDSDAYSSSSSSTPRFDSSTLAQPIPIIGPLIGFPERLIRFRTEATLGFAEKKLGRAVTQEEAQALAGHLYQMESTNSYFTAVGVAVGAWRCYQTAAVNRYPMFLPKPASINPDKFLFIRGPLAQYSRHSWRAMLYMFVAGELGKLCGRIAAQPVAARNTANDPRMAKFSEDLKKAIAIDTQKDQDARRARTAEVEATRRHDRERQRRQEQLPSPNPSPDQAYQADSPYTRNPWSRRATPDQTQDDMSPTAANDHWSPTSEINSSFSSNVTPDTTHKQDPHQRPTKASSWGRTPSPPESDDASPTGGLFEDEVQNQPKPSESAWERLRRGGGPEPSQLPPPRRPDPRRREPRGDPSPSDSFPFTNSGEDRSGARAKAQQEFNAHMQREREGKDFDEEKRW